MLAFETNAEQAMQVLGKVWRKASARIRKAFLSPKRWLSRRVRTIDSRIIRLGTSYGGWHIADNGRLEGAVAILAGAGEDISFDLALQKRFKCQVIIVDPTPRAIAHVQAVMDSIRSGTPMAINAASETYDFDGVDASSIRFLPVALWDAKTTLKFWVPMNSEHVSHSVTNIQGTNSFIEVPAVGLQDVLSECALEPDRLELIKLDIEGAETHVLSAMLQGRLRPSQVLVEYDEIHFPTRASVARVKESVSALEANGYILAHYDGNANCLFVKV